MGSVRERPHRSSSSSRRRAARFVLIGPSDGTSVYVEPNVSVGSSAEITKAPLAGGAGTVVACDRQKIPRRKTVAGGINGAYVSELDMVTTPTELVSTEIRKENGGPDDDRHLPHGALSREARRSAPDLARLGGPPR